MEFITQAVSTVGYGDQSYGSSYEYLFVMALEFCSIGFVALSVIIVSTWVRIQNQSFKTLLDKRMK